MKSAETHTTSGKVNRRGARQPVRFGRFLEVKLHAELQLPGAGGAVVAPDLGGGLAEEGAVVNEIIRLLEVGMVEDVVVLGTEFQNEPLCDFGIFSDDHIEVLVGRAVVSVAVDISRATKQRNSKQADFRSGLSFW